MAGNLPSDFNLEQGLGNHLMIEVCNWRKLPHKHCGSRLHNGTGICKRSFVRKCKAMFTYNRELSWSLPKLILVICVGQ
jgi:hypothetical protein